MAAARIEIAKIELLRTELADTIKSLGHEAAGFDKRLPKVDEDLRKLSRGIEELITPKLTQLRANYAGLADKRGEVREALAIYKSITDAEARRLKIENAGEDRIEGAVSEGDLSAAVAEGFALQVEAVLKDWHFPESERVFLTRRAAI